MKKQTSKKMFNVVIATSLATGAVVAVSPTETGAALQFSDVKETNTHYENILNLADRKVVNGYEDGTYRPGESIKRGNAAQIIARILDLNTTNVKNPGFKDVSTENPKYGAIAALAEAGIIGGFEDNTYRPNETLTRGQMAKIIANAFELTANNATTPFTDIETSQYKENIEALFANKVTTGATATSFDVRSTVTRGQLASFVVRAEEARNKNQDVEDGEEKGDSGEEEDNDVVIPPSTEPPVQPNPPVSPSNPSNPPTFEEEKAAYLQNIINTVNSTQVDSVDIEAQGTEIQITSTDNTLTKGNLNEIQTSILGSFIGSGTTALIDSVVIGNIEYELNPATFDITTLNNAVATAFGIDEETARILGEKLSSEDILSVLPNDTYSGNLQLVFKDNTTETISVTFTK